MVRLSGPRTTEILKKVWKGSDPEGFHSHTAHLGWITDTAGKEIDQAVATYFKAPASFTGEDVAELSCHGSPWIQNAVVSALVEAGASPAGPGEFTKRAFLNGRLDLAQAEGVADMIAASSAAGARLAAAQLKGDFSSSLEELRSRLVDLGTLLELELDFSEEDVEFADRGKLIDLAGEIRDTVARLAGSFKAGNAFKHGVPVAIAGVPNAGKSTLLNALLGEEKAIVSDIPGTTRDTIEDTVEISGILFRLIDTAGIRESDDAIERLGVERAFSKISDASIVLLLLDPTRETTDQLKLLEQTGEERTLKIYTKSDIAETTPKADGLSLSAKTGEGLEKLKERLVELATGEYDPQQELIVTNARHYEALLRAREPLERLLAGLQDGLSADFLAQDLREADRYLGEITGAVSSTEILHSIFSRYCIGK